MAAKILAGKEYSAKFKEAVQKEITVLKDVHKLTPGLAVIIVGENPASKVYVNNKHRTCGELGIYSEVITMGENTTKEELLSKIQELNNRAEINGILVQLPLPEHLQAYEGEMLEAIDPLKDVDGFHPLNVGKLMLGEKTMVPCTPLGCIKLLEAAEIPMEGAKAVVIGRSNIVGKPMAQLLLARNATVTICHSRTKNLKEICQEADIIVVAIGRPEFLTGEMVKPGATIIDVGINRIAPKKLVGDVNFQEVEQVAGAITPVPGGVGLLTIAMLMHNTVEATKLQKGIK